MQSRKFDPGAKAWRRAARKARQLLKQAPRERLDERRGIRSLTDGGYGTDATCVLILLTRYAKDVKDVAISASLSTESRYLRAVVSGKPVHFRFSGHLQTAVTRQLAALPAHVWKRTAPGKWTWAMLEWLGIGREGSHRGRWSTPGRFDRKFKDWCCTQVEKATKGAKREEERRPAANDDFGVLEHVRSVFWA